MGTIPRTIAAPTLEADRRVEWAPLLLLLIALLQGTSFTLTLAVRLAPGGSAIALVTLIWLAGYALAAVVLFSREGIAWFSWICRYRLPLLLLVTGALASAAWSIAPSLSAERGIHLAGSTLVAIAIGFSIPLIHIIRISTVVFAVIMAVSIAAALFMPELGKENYEGSFVWRGVLSSKNTLGFWAAVAALLFATRLADARDNATRVLLIVCILMALVNLVQSDSATSVLAMIVGAMIMLYLYTARSLSLGFIATTCLGLFVLALSALAFRYINTAELIGRSGDLTGRGDLWQQVWHLISLKPLTGFGYGTIWYPTDESLWIQQSLLDLTWISYHAHNGLLQLASEIGLPLTLITVVFALMQLVEIVYSHHRTRAQGSLFVLGFCVAFLVSNYSEARLLVNRELYWIFFVALPISLLRQITLVPVISPRAAFVRQLSPAIRAGMSRRRHSVRLRTDIKKRLLARGDLRPRNISPSPTTPSSITINADLSLQTTDRQPRFAESLTAAVASRTAPPRKP